MSYDIFYRDTEKRGVRFPVRHRDSPLERKRRLMRETVRRQEAYNFVDRLMKFIGSI